MSELLKIHPVAEWDVTRSVEHDPKTEIRYEFEGHGVEVICDGTERIRTIFLHRGDGESLSEVPFSFSRRGVLEHFGPPSSSGGPVRIPVLGDRGAWDRFALPAACLHVQYRIDHDEIDMITLMRVDVVP